MINNAMEVAMAIRGLAILEATLRALQSDIAQHASYMRA